ncbi:hypothetical protein HGQ98_11260, partial [Achromobacter ruhlandii]
VVGRLPTSGGVCVRGAARGGEVAGRVQPARARTGCPMCSRRAPGDAALAWLQQVVRDAAARLAD